ncbi:hypothetical protein CMI46_02745 [Candidatus Pacearchaeota archaeon]|nr:hypothetical protein [Candidatus Pacearchaeota archaeon]
MFEPKFKKNTMKTKPLFGFFLALFTVALVASVASAASLQLIGFNVEVDDTELGFAGQSIVAEDVLPLEVRFTADENASNVEVSAWIRGFRSETRVDKQIDDLVEGETSLLPTRLSVVVPSDLDDDDNKLTTGRDMTLVVRVESDSGSYEEEFTLSAQRQSHDLDLLLVEFDSVTKVDSTLPVSVVVKNLGRHEEDDTFVTVSIPALGISKTSFFEDLFPVDVCDDDGDCDRSDSRERRIFLSIPNGVAPGIYDVKVTAVSDDAETTVIKTLSIVGTPVEGQVLANPAGKTFGVGQTATYEMILVNSGNKIAIYNLVSEAGDALTVSLSDTLTTVPAGSSKTVLVNVKANREGTFNFGVTAVSDGFSETAQYTATVDRQSRNSISGTSNVVALTVVLAIIFVVLLIILIVLLTRRPEKSEEFGESYY